MELGCYNARVFTDMLVYEPCTAERQYLAAGVAPDPVNKVVYLADDLNNVIVLA